MKKFLLNCILFFVALIGLVICFQAILMLPRKKTMTMPDTVNTVYLGNSTIECAVNDSILPNSYNLGRSDETLDIVYAKIKLLKFINPQMDTIVLGFDDIILYNDRYATHASPKAELIDMFNANDWTQNFKYYAVDNNLPFLSSLYNFYNIKPMIQAGFSNTPTHPGYMGGHKKLHRYLCDLSPQQLIDLPNDNRFDNFPGICHYYMDKIIDECDEHNITLIFLTTPKHESLWGDTLYREIHRAYYSTIPHIDCLTMALPDSCFADKVHMNAEGAETFSNTLKEFNPLEISESSQLGIRSHSIQPYQR